MSDNKAKILYVDDEFFNLKLFSINFNEKYKVLTATSGLKALEILSQNHDIPIVVTDLKMPGMDGLEFAQLAKQRHPETMFLLLTGFEMNNDVKRALDTGLLIKYFSKPIDMEGMDATFQELLEHNS